MLTGPHGRGASIPPVDSHGVPDPSCHTDPVVVDSEIRDTLANGVYPERRCERRRNFRRFWHRASGLAWWAARMLRVAGKTETPPWGGRRAGDAISCPLDSMTRHMVQVAPLSLIFIATLSIVTKMTAKGGILP